MTTPKATCAGIALIAALVFGTTAPAWAGSDEAMAAYDRGDYAAALRVWRPLAEQGHANAQFNLGIMYAKGEGVPRDDAEAWKWWRKAADQGHADAQVKLGVRYDLGLGVPQDNAEAAKWYRKAAEQGHAEAQHRLALIYSIGLGVYARRAGYELRPYCQGRHGLRRAGFCTGTCRRRSQWRSHCRDRRPVERDGQCRDRCNG